MSPNIARFPWGGVEKLQKSLKTTVLQSYFKDQKLFPKKENELQWYFKTAGVEEKFSLEVLDPGPDAVTFHRILKTLRDKSLTSALKTMKLSQRGNYLPKVTKLQFRAALQIQALSTIPCPYYSLDPSFGGYLVCVQWCSH